jgi:hypothetical protein
LICCDLCDTCFCYECASSIYTIGRSDLRDPATQAYCYLYTIITFVLLYSDLYRTVSSTVISRFPNICVQIWTRSLIFDGIIRSIPNRDGVRAYSARTLEHRLLCSLLLIYCSYEWQGNCHVFIVLLLQRADQFCGGV